MGDRKDDQAALSPPHDLTRTTSRDTPWWALPIGVVFAVVVAATFSYIMSADPEERAGPSTLSTTADGLQDDFERRASAGGLQSEGTVDGTSEQGIWGVVARYSDPENSTARVRVTQFAVWSIVEVSGDAERVLGKVLDVDDNTVGIPLFVGPEVITANVGLRQTSVVEESKLTGTRSGMGGERWDAASCTWDNLAAAAAR